MSSRNSAAFRGPPNASLANSFLSSCASGACATRPRADAEQLDLAVERRVLAIVQRATTSWARERVVAIELPARQVTRCDALSRVCLALIVTNICTM